MTRTRDIEEFLPHYEQVSLDDIRAALADLDPVQTTLGVSIALPYTRRPEGGPHAGTVDTIEIGPYGQFGDWMIYTGRDFGRGGTANITSKVAACPGHMVILVARALYAHLSAVGPKGRQETYEGDILYALGLSRGEGVPQV